MDFDKKNFSPILGLKSLVVRGGISLPTPLVVRPLKTHCFYVCLPLHTFKIKGIKNNH